MRRLSLRSVGRFVVPLVLAAGFAGTAKSSASDGGDSVRPVPGAAVAQQGGSPAKSREFDFTCSAKVTGLRPGETARIWLPMPPSNEDQEAGLVKQVLPCEAETATGTEEKYGNKVLYIAARAGEDGSIPVAVTYRVKRSEVKADAKSAKVAREEIELFLKPDAKVPVGGKPLALLDGKSLPDDQFQLSRVLYDVVNDHMTYSKQGTGWGNGDALWACDSRYGNCSDFHSLFISLARSKKIPAKFEMGFPLPPERGSGEIPGYHCWAKFKPEGRGWIPVDISEANKVRGKNPQMVEYYFGNLTEDRVTFTIGRDLMLVPRQDGPPLNFFVYPYVEVAGKPYPPDKVERKFAFQDVGATAK